jgi:hypothetical protein
MAAFLSDDVLDDGLQVLTDDANILHICSAQPADFAGIAAVTLGNKPTPTVGAPTNGTTSGRKVVVSAITDGEVTGTDTATHWALADSVGSRLLAANTLSSSQAVTDGNTFTLDAIDIEIPDPA